jgi:hypothetical protein
VHTGIISSFKVDNIIILFGFTRSDFRSVKSNLIKFRNKRIASQTKRRGSKIIVLAENKIPHIIETKTADKSTMELSPFV